MSLTVSATQAINFGSFCVTGPAGGTVTVAYDGARSATGDIMLLSVSPVAQPAIFEIKLCEGRNVALSFNKTIFMSGNNGSLLTLDIGPTEKGINGESFPVTGNCDFITILRVGGTITVPASAAPGAYTGNFEITLIKE